MHNKQALCEIKNTMHSIIGKMYYPNYRIRNF